MRPQPFPCLGPWQLVRHLGEGAWTQVFQARPTGSGREETADYTIKLIKPELQGDPVAIATLQREAFITRQVRHPHLSAILSAHTDSAPYFVVMPYLAGATLADAIGAAGRLMIPHAAWLTRQTADALGALHRQGWMHGDLKPANIFVAESGHVTLLDLGLARRIETRPRSDETLSGTLAYSPPEVFHRNLPLTAASDVYSLGIVLYEALTGAKPFQEQDTTELAAAHLTRHAPDPRSTVPQLPRRLSRLIRTMLAKEPLRRPAIEELIDALVEIEIATLDERWMA